MDYHPDLAGEINCRVIFSSEGSSSPSETLPASIETLGKAFPTALFQLSFESREALDEFLSASTLSISRFLIGYSEPELIYSSLRLKEPQPFGYSLGAFVEENSGELDYEKCDVFLEQYQELVNP